MLEVEWSWLARRGRRLECVGEALDLGAPCLDGLAELDLDAGAFEVLAGVVDFEVVVAGEVVGEETDGQFEGDESDGVVEVVFVGVGEEIS